MYPIRIGELQDLSRQINECNIPMLNIANIQATIQQRITAISDDFTPNDTATTEEFFSYNLTENKESLQRNRGLIQDFLKQYETDPECSLSTKFEGMFEYIVSMQDVIEHLDELSMDSIAEGLNLIAEKQNYHLFMFLMNCSNLNKGMNVLGETLNLHAKRLFSERKTESFKALDQIKNIYLETEETLTKMLRSKISANSLTIKH